MDINEFESRGIICEVESYLKIQRNLKKLHLNTPFLVVNKNSSINLLQWVIKQETSLVLHLFYTRSSFYNRTFCEIHESKIIPEIIYLRLRKL